MTPPTDGSIPDLYSDEDDYQSSNSQFLREDAEAFYFDRPSVALDLKSPEAPAQQQQLGVALSNHSQYTLHTPLPTTTEYVDPFIAVKDMLWLLPDIDDIVKNTLERLGKAFAYNSVYFLKVILDLQVIYLPMKPPPPPEAMLDLTLVLKIASVLSGRLTRKENDGTSLSRELQLRTFISALSLLYLLDGGNLKLNSDTYAKLLRDITERDADNVARHARNGADSFKTGENEYLTRYACDLVRCLPNDLPPVFKELNQEAIHFIFAAGFINQLEEKPSKKTIENVHARITAPPSQWHTDMRHLYEGTVTAIALQHQAKSGNPPMAAGFTASLASDVMQSIVDKLEKELEDFGEHKHSSLSCLPQSHWRDSDVFPFRDGQMLICGLLDLLSQLVSTFPKDETVVAEPKALALRLIRHSDKRAFRYKAFEIMICSTLGVGEKEYYDTMRDLELEIEDAAQTSTSPGVDGDEDLKLKAMKRAEQLKIEKREAMDRCEKKNVLSTGGAESMQRRLQGSFPAGRATPGIEDMIRAQTPAHAAWDKAAVRAASPEPSTSSQAPTLSSSQSWETTSNHSLAAPPASERQSPAVDDVATPCKSAISQANTWQTVSSATERDSPLESASPQTRSPRTPQDMPLPTEASELDLPSEVSGLFAAGLSLFEDPEEYGEDRPHPPHANNARKMSFDLPIQNFGAEDQYPRSPEPVSPPSPNDMPFGNLPDIKEFPNSPSDQYPSPMTENQIDSPMSTYPEPSLSRTPSGQTTTSTIRRQSRVLRANRMMDKPLPPVAPGERTKDSIIAENAPEPVRVLPRAEPVGRSQSAMGIREGQDHDSRPLQSSNSVRGFHTPQRDQFFVPLDSIVDATPEDAPELSSPMTADYETTPTEKAFKCHFKDTCFSTFLSSDVKHAVFLSSHSFQVFAIPGPDQAADLQLKPKFHYRLGEWEGLKKSKVRWQYKTAALSDRFVVTITKEQLQVHDLTDECKIIFMDRVKGWEYSAVTVAADKLVVGLSKGLLGEDIGTVRIYSLNDESFPGHRYQTCRKDIHLPISPKYPQDAPSIMSLTRDGRYVTCGTPKFGYYFVWDISYPSEPRLAFSNQLKRYQGPDAETLTNVMLFPDCQHLLCSTFPARSSKAERGGCFTEALYTQASGTSTQRHIRHVSLHIIHSAVSSQGNACAFVSKNGTIWVTLVQRLESDDNLTSFGLSCSKERLQAQTNSDSSGKVAFAPSGERVVAVDKKGKILVLTFPIKQDRDTPQTYDSASSATVVPSVLSQGPPAWVVSKEEYGGYF